jgi:ATP-dependent DNA helicase RecQ
MQEIQSILKTYWGFSEFRPLQKEIIDSVLEGKDTLALLPTGGGKSICFQVPALAQDGVCLVISPLIALMKDQVENLKKKGILAAAIYSGMSRGLMIQTLKNIAYGPYKFLYISPERIETSLFQEYLPAFNVNLIAIDEAHCISQWGYDFRPSYLRIASLREYLPDVPVLALTASATEEVQKDICEKLGFKEQIIFRPSFHRKNLSYSVFPVDVKMKKLLEILTKVPGSALVYCKSRKRTVETASLLQMHGLSAQAYHAGLSQEERNKRQQEWVEGKNSAMVCTNAFGMGIDKPDVRTVVHIDVPDCLENYYQEAGRAGRDGKKSYAVLLYSGNDLEDLKNLHTKRFPSFDQIKEVYGAVCNYLQVAINTGEDNSYPFYFEAFIKNFKLDSHTALYSLKTLEQDGWLDFNEKNFSPSTIVFTTNKEQLYQFQ